MDTNDYIKTTFNCPIELRDRIEQCLIDNPSINPDELMKQLLSCGLEHYQFPL